MFQHQLHCKLVTVIKKFKPASLKLSETSAVIIMLMIMRSMLTKQALCVLCLVGGKRRSGLAENFNYLF